MSNATRLGLILGLAVLGLAPSARAQSESEEVPAVELSPFGGYQFGGSLHSPDLDQTFSMKASPVFGGQVDVSIGGDWRVEGLYSHSSTDLEGAGSTLRYGLTVERLMIGLQEEKGVGSSKYFGTFLLGATRFKPELSGFESKSRFTLGLALGLKPFFNPHFGLRLEGDAFWTVVESEGGFYCTNGRCLFNFTGSGLWQTSLTGGVIFAF